MDSEGRSCLIPGDGDLQVTAKQIDGRRRDGLTPVQERRQGVLAALASAACFAVNDALVKTATQSMPISQLIFVRGAFAVALILVAARIGGISISRGALSNPRILIRALLDTLAAFASIIGLTHLPLANATAIFMASPLFISLAVSLGAERVSLRRWVTILTGFCGVLLVVQPATTKFNGWSLLVLFSACFAAARDLVTRSVAREFPSLVVTLATILVAMLAAGACASFQTWESLSVEQLSILAFASCAVSCGYFFVTMAMRTGQISVIAPFRYSALIFAAVLGYLVWGDIPNALAWFGMGLTVAAGIYLLRTQ